MYNCNLFTLFSGRFTFINAEWPGGAHDSFVFQASSLQDHLEANNRTLKDGVLLGDSGYVLIKLKPVWGNKQNMSHYHSYQFMAAFTQ